jgi:predicted transcriptional regulator
VPESLKRRHNVTFRIRDDLRAKLQTAADLSDRSLSEELERRIELSFDRSEAVRDLIGGLSRFLDAESKAGGSCAP